MQASRNLPSTKWTSFEGWDYDGMRERLEATIREINKDALISHAEKLKGKNVTMSEAFSAGQSWICFELISEDGSLLIARVRLTPHPEAPVTRREKDDAHAIACEISTMEFVRQRLPMVPVPRLYAYEGPDSQLAAEAGAVYMLLEGFYGNTLLDVEPNICKLRPETQEHIMAQWTRVQAELATISYPQIGSICSVSEAGEPVFGPLVASSIGELNNTGPFPSAIKYFTAVADAAIDNPNSSSSVRLGAFVFRDIVNNTALFNSNELFPFSHMDLGPHNILVDGEFNLVAVIDWEYSQTAPWPVNRYPMPFPLVGLDIEEILKDPSHVAYGTVSRQDTSRGIYRDKFREAESQLTEQGRALGVSFADTLESKASRIYACFTTLGRFPRNDVDVIRDMVRLAYGFNRDQAVEHVRSIEQKM